MFDPWEYPEKCKKCDRYDNHDPKQPVTVLDSNNKLCEFCYEDMEDEVCDLPNNY